MKQLYELMQMVQALTQTELGALATLSNVASPEMGHTVMSSSRNATSAKDSLTRAGYIQVDVKNKHVMLTAMGRALISRDNIVDNAGELTTHGRKLLQNFTQDNSEWERNDA